MRERLRRFWTWFTKEPEGEPRPLTRKEEFIIGLVAALVLYTIFSVLHALGLCGM